jgi:hypothetical protein
LSSRDRRHGGDENNRSFVPVSHEVSGHELTRRQIVLPIIIIRHLFLVAIDIGATSSPHPQSATPLAQSPSPGLRIKRANHIRNLSFLLQHRTDGPLSTAQTPPTHVAPRKRYSLHVRVSKSGRSSTRTSCGKVVVRWCCQVCSQRLTSSVVASSSAFSSGP